MRLEKQLLLLCDQLGRVMAHTENKVEMEMLASGWSKADARSHFAEVLTVTNQVAILEV